MDRPPAALQSAKPRGATGARRRAACAALWAVWTCTNALAQVAPSDTSTASHYAPQITGLIRDSRLAEISGLATSRRHAGVLWVHNDSGAAAELHAIDTRGRRLATLRIRDVEARDFEDMAAFERDGVSYLLVADTGDNGGRRDQVQLVVVAEPAELQDADVDAAWTQRLRWPDGPRDVEAVVVDAAASEVLLIAKKRQPPELLSVPLGPAPELQLAQRIGELAGIEAPSAQELAGNPRFGRYRAQVTAADLSPDGLQLAVLNYRRAYVYTRASGEAWRQAVQRPPSEHRFGWLAQAEAIAFDSAGRGLWITSERVPAPLIALPLP